jgi:acetylcholinesterase
MDNILIRHLELFRYAIAESGSMLTDWALDRNATKHGYRIAELAGCPLEPYADLLHCLRSIDPVALRRAQGDYSVGFTFENIYDYLAIFII